MTGRNITVSGVARRYAKALFSLASERGVIDSVRQDLASFSSLVEAAPDLANLVSSPVFTPAQQTRVIETILAQAGIAGLTVDFIRIVIRRRRLADVACIIAGFNHLVDESRGIVHATVTSAAVLSGAQLQAVRSVLEKACAGGSLVLSALVDPSLIGGLRVQLGALMLDSSVSYQLDSLRKHMRKVG